MSNTPSPLRLKRSLILSTRVEAAVEIPEASSTPISSSVVWREVEDDPRDWRIELEVSFGEQDGEIFTSYHGVVSVALELQVHPGFPDDKIEQLVRVNGTSLAYGVVREVVSNLSARGPHGVYILPSISFMEPKEGDKTPSTVPKAKKKRAKSATKSSASRKEATPSSRRMAPAKKTVSTGRRKPKD